MLLTTMKCRCEQWRCNIFAHMSYVRYLYRIPSCLWRMHPRAWTAHIKFAVKNGASYHNYHIWSTKYIRNNNTKLTLEFVPISHFMMTIARSLCRSPPLVKTHMFIWFANAHTQQAICRRSMNNNEFSANNSPLKYKYEQMKAAQHSRKKWIIFVWALLVR